MVKWRWRDRRKGMVKKGESKMKTNQWMTWTLAGMLMFRMSRMYQTLMGSGDW
jgi:hypothetical protein